MIKNTWINVTMIFAVFALFTGIAGAQNALPNFPVGLQGSVSIGGNPAPPDTVIIAKVGDAVVGLTKVQSAGTYGDKPTNLLPVVADDGATVDIYVNGAKITTFTYYLKDAGKTFPADLTAPGGGISAGGGNSAPVGEAPSPTATAATAKSVSGGYSGGNPGTKETQVTPAVPPTAEFKFFAILGAFVLLIAGATIGLVLKKRGKL